MSGSGPGAQRSISAPHNRKVSFARVASRVDTLVCSSVGTLPLALLDDLIARRVALVEAATAEGKEAEPFDSGLLGPDGSALLVRPFVARSWSLLLTCAACDVKLRKRGGRSGVAGVVEFRATWLWSLDQSAVLQAADDWSARLLGAPLVPSRVDHCQDIAGEVMSALCEPGTSWVKPAETPESWDGPREEPHAVTLGTHGSAVSVQVYDKPKEIAAKGDTKGWLYEVWKLGGWDGSTPVYRHEARFTREFLHTCRWVDRSTGEVRTGVNSLSDLLAALPDLHAYAVLHMRHVVASRSAAASERSRSAVSAVWRVISAPLDGSTPGYKLARSWRRVVDQDRLRCQLRGVATSLYALLPGWERLTRARLGQVIAAEVTVWAASDDALRDALAVKRLRYAACAA